MEHQTAGDTTTGRAEPLEANAELKWLIAWALPSKAAFRAITPELIETQQMLEHYRISREQLIDLAIMVGTDFNTHSTMESEKKRQNSNDVSAWSGP